MTNREEGMYALAKDILDIVKGRFGNRVEDWIFTGIEIDSSGPFLKYYPQTGHVTIVLSLKVIDDDEQLLFQLAHEVAHLLHPSREYPSFLLNETLVINEGLSTLFSIGMMQENFNKGDVMIDNLREFSPNYYDASMLVNELIRIDPEAIKKVREIQPRIDKLTFKDFETAGLNVPDELKIKLLTPFKAKI